MMVPSSRLLSRISMQVSMPSISGIITSSKNQVRSHFDGHLNGFSPIAGGVHREPFFFEVVLNELQNVWFVIDNEDFLLSHDPIGLL